MTNSWLIESFRLKPNHIELVVIMQYFMPTIVLRHRRENLKKCSLRGLESRDDFKFYTYPQALLPDLSSYVLLAMDGQPLSKADANSGIFLLDATWRHALPMRKFVDQHQLMPTRSIPAGFCTAYPRRQDDCPNPEEGLASIEALYIAYIMMGKDPVGLLDHYHWKELFLMKNAERLLDLVNE